MLTTTVKIEDVTQKTSKAGKQYGYVLTDQGGMSCWDSDLYGKLLEARGKVVVATYEVNDKGYKSIKSIVAPTPEQDFERAIEDRTQDYQSKRDLSILKQVSLKAAVEHCEVTNSVEDVLATAARFFVWLKEDRV